MNVLRGMLLVGADQSFNQNVKVLDLSSCETKERSCAQENMSAEHHIAAFLI